MVDAARALCYRQQLPPPEQELQELLPQEEQDTRPQVQRTFEADSVPSLHRDDWGYSGRLKNSSHTESENSSAGGMLQKP